MEMRLAQLKIGDVILSIGADSRYHYTPERTGEPVPVTAVELALLSVDGPFLGALLSEALGHHVPEGDVASCVTPSELARVITFLVERASPACGHSACRQHWIDTGRGECVQA